MAQNESPRGRSGGNERDGSTAASIAQAPQTVKRYTLCSDIEAAIAKAELALARYVATPPCTGDRTHRDGWILANSFTASELRAFSRDCEDNASAARTSGYDDLALWWLQHHELIDAAYRAVKQAEDKKLALRLKASGRKRVDYAALRESIDIVALAESRTKLRKSGRLYKGCCPLHDEKTASFVVYPEQHKFYCFGCGAHGDSIDLAKALGVQYD